MISNAFSFGGMLDNFSNTTEIFLKTDSGYLIPACRFAHLLIPLGHT